MHRRAFAAALFAVPFTTFAADVRACDVAPGTATPESATSDPGASPESAERLFRWPGDDGPRSLWIRVQRHSSREAAEAGQDAWMKTAVPEELPPGEFYGSDLQVIEIPDVPAGADVRMHAWHTTVGVAAYTTAYAAFTARYGLLLWTGSVVASYPGTAVALASDLIAMTQEVPAPCASLEGLLPEVEDLPDGAQL